MVNQHNERHSVAEALLSDALAAAPRKLPLQLAIGASLAYFGVAAGEPVIGAAAGLLATAASSSRTVVAWRRREQRGMDARQRLSLTRVFEASATAMAVAVALIGVVALPAFPTADLALAYVLLVSLSFGLSMTGNATVGRSMDIYLGIVSAGMLVGLARMDEAHWHAMALVAVLAILLRRAARQQSVLFRAPKILLDSHERTVADARARTFADQADAARAAERLALERQRTLVGKVSHELRTPVQTIATVIEMTELTGELSPRNLARLRAANDSLLEQMRELTAYVRSDHQPDPSPHKVGLRPLLDSVISLIQEEVDRKGLELRVVCDDVTIRTQPYPLQQALRNLLSNAVQYTDRGWVQVTCMLEGTEDAPLLRVEVQDTGRGIGDADPNRLFEPFYRGSGAEPGQGMGLGLAIVQNTAIRLGGFVELNPRVPGPGTVAAMVIPLCTKAPRGPRSLLSGP